MASHRKVLFAVLGGAGYALGVEPRWQETVHRVVLMPGLSAPVRLVHLSDLHASSVVTQRMIAGAVARAVAARPDAVCLTGDFISHRDVPSAEEYAATLRPLAEAGAAFAVLGNHDGGVWSDTRRGFHDHEYVERVLKLAGIELLMNVCRTIEVRGQRLQLVGVGDVWAGELEPAAAFQKVRPGIPTVLLSHNPDTKEDMADRPWHLMLSGHTHGGQVVLPLYGPPFVPVRDRRYVAGLKSWGERQIHVTRGVGNLLGVRFGCRPEVAVLELAPLPGR